MKARDRLVVLGVFGAIDVVIALVFLWLFDIQMAIMMFVVGILMSISMTLKLK